MELLVLDNLDLVSKKGADLVCQAVKQKPNASVVVATGESPMGVYAELGLRVLQGYLDTSQLRIFQLDEYLDIGENDPQSLYGWMKKSFLEPLRIPETNVVRLRGDSVNPELTCASYDREVSAAGGFDLALLGLGLNGHLGFNEPPANPESPCRVVHLADSSIASGARYWGGEDRVPRHALTAGMASLLAARRTVLIVTGSHKRDILSRVLHGPMTPEVPASYLQSSCGVTVLADRDAGVTLEDSLSDALPNFERPQRAR